MRFLILFGLVTVSHCATLLNTYNSDWQEFKLKFNKHYLDIEEEQQRLKSFLETKDEITKHNLRYERGDVTFTMGINQFSDRLEAKQNSSKSLNRTRRSNVTSSLYPSHVDWRQMGAVTPVRDQGLCDSCFIFATLGALESQYFIKKGVLVPLSHQTIVDCPNFKCGAGTDHKSTVYDYIAEQKGIESEESYPYVGKLQDCRFNSTNVVATTHGYIELREGDEDQLLETVAKVGPVAIEIDARHPSFWTYSGGIYDEPDCEPVFVGDKHAMLVVGYGSENGTDYWIVRNSWGETWGEKGYIRMARNKNNQCGIATAAVYPVVY